MRASVSKNDSCVCVCVRERESVCVIVVDFGKKKETNLSARQKKCIPVLKSLIPIRSLS